jgi:hypothetical protein
MSDKKSELSYLKANEIDYLNWDWNFLGQGYRNKIAAVRKGMYTDGNCFFHSILNATSSKYRSKDKKNQLLMCDELRKSFANTLTYKQFISLKVDNGYVYNDDSYSAFIKGDAKDLNVRYEAYKAYISESGRHVGTEVIHLVGKELDIDIYLMRQNKGNGELVIQPIPTEEAFLKRPSVILLYLGNHYEIIGIAREGGELADFFYPSNHYVILELYKKQKEGWKELSKVYEDSAGEAGKK